MVSSLEMMFRLARSPLLLARGIAEGARLGRMSCRKLSTCSDRVIVGHSEEWADEEKAKDVCQPEWI